MKPATARRSTLVMALVLAASMCSGAPATFYNPRTGAVSQCRPTDLDPFGDQCAGALESSGWVRYEGKPVIERAAPPRTSP